MSRLTLSRTGVLAASLSAGAATDPDLAYLMSCVAGDGAITETPGDVNVRPYMSHYACIGLARAYEITSDPTVLAACWAWLDWYAARMDGTTGYVNDFTTSDGGATWTDSGAADSTDAYAGMFLTALWATFIASGSDLTKLATYATALDLAVTAITSTQQVYGLTWALSSFTSAYLEDNVETLVGLTNAVSMIGINGGDATAAGDAQDLAFKGFGYYYNEQTGTFDWAIDASDVFTPNDWGNENSQRQQVWALGWGATPPYGTEAGDLLAAYVTALPGWSTQTSTYEVMAAWAYLRLGDTGSAAGGVANLKANAASNSRAYPWTCQTSGQIYVADKGFSSALTAASVNWPNGTNMLDFDGRDPAFYADSDNDGRGDFVSNFGTPTMTLLTDPDGPTGAHIQQMASASGGEDMRWDPVSTLVVENAFYIFSFDRKVTALNSGGDVVIKMEMLDVSGTLVDYTYDVWSSVDTGFVRWSLRKRVAATVTQIRCIIGIDTGGTVQVRQPKLERAGAGPTNWVYPDPPATLSVVDHFSDLVMPVDTASGTLTWDNSVFDSAHTVVGNDNYGNNVGYDGWLWFIPTKDCTITIDTVGTGTDIGSGAPDTQIWVWQQFAVAGGLDSLLLVGGDDDNGGAHGGSGATSWYQLPAQAGQSYFVAVGMHGGHAPSTTMVVNWSGLDLTTPGDDVHARNDDIALAQTISGAGQDIPYSNYDYTEESGEPSVLKFRSSWYTFVPTTSGPVTLDTQLTVGTAHFSPHDGADAIATTDTYLTLYTGPDGATVTGLTEVASDDDSGGSSTSLISAFAATGGQRYYVRAQMYHSTNWNDQFVLRWSIP